MTPSSDFHRTADGSIDFDFYRRDAARQRGLAQRRMGRRLHRALAEIARAARSLSLRERSQRIALRNT